MSDLPVICIGDGLGNEDYRICAVCNWHSEPEIFDGGESIGVRVALSFARLGLHGGTDLFEGMRKGALAPKVQAHVCRTDVHCAGSQNTRAWRVQWQVSTADREPCFHRSTATRYGEHEHTVPPTSKEERQSDIADGA